MTLTKIGALTTEDGRRIDIMWDGATLCTSNGEEIMDGQADTLEKAEALAQWLWNAPEWDYESLN